MTAAAEQMLPSLLALPESDRAELFNLLGESLEPPMSEEEEQAFEKELDRRTEDFLSGREKGISPQELFAELDAMLGARAMKRARPTLS